MTNEHAATIILVALIIGSLALSVFFYSNMPGEMATHWNLKGAADGFSSKEVGLFIFPTLLGLLTVIYLLIPNIDPLRKNILKFERQFGVFMILLSTFFIVIQAQIISWNKGVTISPNFTTTIALGIILFYAGILLKHAKRNYFIGIRTPWTLHSDYVWKRTHEVGSVLFRIAALVLVLATLTKITYWIILITIISVVIITIIYSYILYSKEKKGILKHKKVSKKTPNKKSTKKKNFKKK
jgi:uncharacterized membrane protein